MKIGLLADIHEHVNELRVALGRFAEEGVDEIVVLGDVFGSGERIEETCRLLLEAGAVGVWGNHDFGLSYRPSDALRARFGPVVHQFMTGLGPRLEIGRCLCVHVEPWLDPFDVMDLWYFQGPPDTPEKVARIFGGFEQPVSFGGHYHRWLLVTEDGIETWAGDRTLALAPDRRYFIVINALFSGHYAVFDDDTGELRPGNLFSDRAHES